MVDVLGNDLDHAIPVRRGLQEHHRGHELGEARDRKDAIGILLEEDAVVRVDDVGGLHVESRDAVLRHGREPERGRTAPVPRPGTGRPVGGGGGSKLGEAPEVAGGRCGLSIHSRNPCSLKQ